MNTIGTNIRVYRQGIGLTLDELAEKVGLTKSTLSRYENGQYEPNYETVVDIAEALDVHPALLYGFVDVGYEGWFNDLPDDQQRLLMMYEEMTKTQKQQALEYCEFLLRRK